MFSFVQDSFQHCKRLWINRVVFLFARIREKAERLYPRRLLFRKNLNEDRTLLKFHMAVIRKLDLYGKCVPHTANVSPTFVPILEQGQDPFAMFVDLQNRYDWVLKPVIGYSSIDRLLEVLEDKIVRPAEAKFNELLARRTEKLRVENV